MTAVRTMGNLRPVAGGSPPSRGSLFRRAADTLCLAASPAFAAMALASYLSPGMAAMSCASMADASPVGGMTTMYLLMGVFHLAPWLRLGSARQASAGDA